MFLFSGAEQLQKAKVLIADADVWAHFAYHYLRQGQGGILPFLWHLIAEIVELKYIGNGRGNTKMLRMLSCNEKMLIVPKLLVKTLLYWKVVVSPEYVIQGKDFFSLETFIE